MDHEEAIGMFIAVTDAPRHIAEHVLDAHHWDLNNSVAFFLESGGVGHGVQNAGIGILGEPADVEALEATPLQQSSPQDESRGIQPVPVPIDEDEDLQILASSLNRRPRARQVEGIASGDDSDVQVVGSLEDEFAVNRSNGRRTRRNRPRRAGSVDRDLQLLGQRFGLMDDEDDVPATSMRASLQPAQQARPVQSGDEVALPDDVDLEEQKMLMAALTGGEYEGQLPDFSTGPRFRPQQLSPGAQERQQLRAEQDAAYYESLQADMEREAAEAMVKEEAAQAERAAREAQEAEEQRQREEQRRLERTISSKQASLPPEPDEGGEGVVNIMIRMPKGSRINRRFQIHDSLQSVFDFVDVQRLEEAKPHTYHLVMQYPRRTFEEYSDLTLADAGLKSKQEALFLEMK